MIKKLGSILLISILTLGQPMAALANTVTLDFQLDYPDRIEVIKNEDNIHTENSSEDSFFGYHGSIENPMNVTNETNDQFINTRQTEDELISEDISEINDALTDKLEENQLYLENESDGYSSNTTELSSVTWGTANWEYNNEFDLLITNYDEI